MADARLFTLLAAILQTAAHVSGSVKATDEQYPCTARARTEAGVVCGLHRWAEDGHVYASFRGVPYAKQPLGELRFQELQPVEPWDHEFDARFEGPVCYQTDVIYGSLSRPARPMSEACIHANIHVPLEALPEERWQRNIQTPYSDSEEPGLPILVSVHGGSFVCGSGDADLHGPEYLVTKNVIVITFNYRLNVFGFLSLGSAQVPGNQGLRDMVTLLRWVRRNARAFGGDPDNVTLLGQSAGATAVHILSLSEAAQGLFQRAILMSGTAISTYFSPTRIYSETIKNLFLAKLNIDDVTPEEIHQKLIQTPAKKINEIHRELLDAFGLITFVPTVEDFFPGVTRIVDKDPEVLLASGRGNNITLVVGFTNVECEVFRKRFQELDIVSKVNKNPSIIIPAQFLYLTPPKELFEVMRAISQSHLWDSGNLTLNSFIKYCSDAYYKYPALKLAESKTKSGGAPLYLYEFAYDSEKSVLKEALGLRYRGAAHIEDLTYVFRVNSVLGEHHSLPPTQRDDYMKEWFTTFVVNFMHCSSPVCIRNQEVWPPVREGELTRQVIASPGHYRQERLSQEQRDILALFSALRAQ